MIDANLSAADRRLTLTGLAVVLLLSALDQTVVATAMPRIIEQLQGLSMYAWVTTAYMLTSTVSVPIYGKLSDQYGRRPILLAGVGLFLSGSALCGLAGEFGALPVLGGGMTQLVVFRALQGLGAGALMTVSFAIVADMYSPRERGRLFGVFAAVFGLAAVVGPFIGGFLTDHGDFTVLGYDVAGWRWVFYVNLPLGLAALFMVLHRMPALRPAAAAASSVRVDYPGAVLVVVTATSLLLALTLGGAQYAWDSPQVIGLLAVAAVALIFLLKVEMKAAQPILPLHLFRIPTFRLATLATFTMNMAFLGVVMFMPLYMQAVLGVSATRSGVELLPLMLAMILSSTASGRLVTRTGRYKPLMIGGGVLLIAGVVALSAIGPDTTTGDLAWRLALTGVGLGPAQTLFSLVIQNAAPHADIGAATGMSQFSRQMGATVGVAVFGAFLTHGLMIELPKHVPASPGSNTHSIDLSYAQTEAMDVDVIRARINQVLDERYAVIERAYAGDLSAVSEVLEDPRLPEQMKNGLREGGVSARVHRELTERAETLESELAEGEAGRRRLLQAPDVAGALRNQIEHIPPRVLADPQHRAKVAAMFREALLAKQDAIVAAETQRSLQAVRNAMAGYSEWLVEQTQRGVKTAFASAIVHMLQWALWIVIAAVAIVVFIPELPLRTHRAE